MVRLRQKKLHFQMEFTTISMSLLRRLISCVKMSNFYFEQQRASGGKIYISINCDKKCKMLRHINFSDNLLRMLGFSAAISSKHQFYSKLAINLISMRQKRKLFLLSDLIRRRGNHIQSDIGVSNIVCGVLSLIKCSYIAIFVCLI